MYFLQCAFVELVLLSDIIYIKFYIWKCCFKCNRNDNLSWSAFASSLIRLNSCKHPDLSQNRYRYRLETRLPLRVYKLNLNHHVPFLIRLIYPDLKAKRSNPSNWEQCFLRKKERKCRLIWISYNNVFSIQSLETHLETAGLAGKGAALVEDKIGGRRLERVCANEQPA